MTFIAFIIFLVNILKIERKKGFLGSSFLSVVYLINKVYNIK